MAKAQKPKSFGRFALPAAAAVVLLAALALLLVPQNGQTKNLSETEALTIPLSSVTETASFYPVVVDGTEIEVLAIRTAGGEVRTAFNTCQSCFSSGRGYYVAEEKELVCQNCGFRFTAEQVGLEGRGGCNPWPIPASVRVETAESIMISYDTLAGAKKVFSRWGKQ